MKRIKNLPLFLIVALLLGLESPFAKGPYRPPSKKNMNYYAMGGALTALPNHDLTSWYNPAALAYTMVPKKKAKIDFDDGFVVESSGKAKKIISIAKLETSVSFPFTESESYRTLLDYFDLLGDTSALPPGFLQIGQAIPILNSFLIPLDEKEMISPEKFLSDTNYSSQFLKDLNAIKQPSGGVKINFTLFQFQTWKQSIALLENFNSIHISLPSSSYVSFGIPSPKLECRNDLILLDYGYGFSLKGSPEVAFGFSARIFNTVLAEIDPAQSLPSLADYPIVYNNFLSAISDPLGALTGGIDFGDYNNYLSIGTGATLDLGFLYNFAKGAYVGMTMHNAPGYIIWLGDGKKEFIKSTFDIGASYQADFQLLNFFNNPSISISISDIFNIYKEPLFKHLHYGVKFRTFFDYIETAAGINDGYLSVKGELDFNTRFLSKVPVIKLFFPKERFRVLFFPKGFDIDSLSDFYRRNPIVYLGSFAGSLANLFNLKLTLGYYALELNTPRYAIPDPNLFFAINANLDF